MKVLLPFTPPRLRGEVIRFVMDNVPIQSMVWTNCEGDEYAYWRAVMGRWDAGEDFIVLEHDVVPDQEQWDRLVTCDAGWCQQGYGGIDFGDEIGHGWVDNGHPGRIGHPGASAPMLALGCTKFNAQFIHRQAERVLGMKPAPWHQLDSSLFASFSYDPPHIHPGRARHVKGF